MVAKKEDEDPVDVVHKHHFHLNLQRLHLHHQEHHINPPLSTNSINNNTNTIFIINYTTTSNH